MPNGNTEHARASLFPIHFLSHVIILWLALNLGSHFYQTVLTSAHESFSSALGATQVGPYFLKNYGRSERFFAGESSEHASDNSIVIDARTLSPREMAILLVEAGVIKEKDVEDPSAVLDINKGGVGAWLSNTLVATKHPDSGLTLADALAGKEIDGDTLSTIQVLIMLYESLGIGGEKTEPTASRVAAFSNHLTGHQPELCPLTRRLCSVLDWLVIGQDVSDQSTSNVDTASEIKSAMQNPYRIYDYSLGGSNLPIQRQHFYSTNNTYSSIDPNATPGTEVLEAELEKMGWFEVEPHKLSDAVFKFSYLMIKELYRHPDVRANRFVYQAFRGEIQWVLMVLISYLIVLMTWRFLQVQFGRELDAENFPKNVLPIRQRGLVTKDTYETELLRARASVDQWINALPLIGLFGTVYGISLALPNAAAAVSGSGPGAAENINSLFEQLGLAFVTTAIAVAGVIVLDYVWEKIGQFEEKRIWKLMLGSA